MYIEDLFCPDVFVLRLPTLKHENWKGHLARIGCRAYIMHVLLDHSLDDFRQFNINMWDL
jgi:hypothetical protein